MDSFPLKALLLSKPLETKIPAFQRSHTVCGPSQAPWEVLG